MGYYKELAIEEEWLREAAKQAEEDERRWQEQQQHVAALNQKYEEQYPNHCKTCGGWGQQSWTENQSPLGSGEYWPESFTEPCDDCYAAGKCARCGASLPDDENGEPVDHCKECGWKAGQDGLQTVYL